MFQDLRYGARMLRKNPGLTAAAIITLSLGIGANTVIFSGVYTLLLQPLPYPQADRLVVVWQTSRQGVESGISHPDFIDWKEQNTVFEQMAAVRTLSANLTDRDPVERVTGSYVSSELFPLMGGRAWLGRTFFAEEFRPGSDKTILLSYGFWQNRFGADPGVIGQQLKLDDERFTVIGVMPPSFQYPFRAAFWLPLEANEKAETLRDAAANLYEVVARLKSEANAERAAQEMMLLKQRAARPRSAVEPELAVKVASLREAMGISKYRMPVLALQFAVVFVLLIASVNLANLLLARNTERRQEFTVRLALGAGPGRLIRQLLTESLLLGLLGSSLGLLLAQWGLQSLRTIKRIPGLAEVEINAPVLLFTLTVSLLTTLGFGLAPALLSARLDVHGCLKSGASSASADPRQRRLSGALVAAEVALAVVLLAASGLMIRTLLNLTQENPGFNPDHAIALTLALPPAQYPDEESLAAYFNEAIQRIKALPGVQSVGGVSYLPLIGYNPGTDFTIEGQRAPAPEMNPRADFQPITPDYFQAIGIPLSRGRQFTDADLKPAPEAVIINQALAKKYWPDEDPLGKHIRLQGQNASRTPLAVVGIVGDVKQFGLHTDPRPEIYLPMYRHSMTLIVRTSVSPGSLFAALRESVQQLGKNRAAYNLRTMEQVVIDSIEKRRIFALLLGTMAAVALAMAAMGIYGVISYLAAQRTPEIGLRMALGAGSSDVLRLIVGQGMRLVTLGLAIGLLSALVASRVLKSLFYDVSATDPATFLGVASLLAGVALLACYFPARRATRVDPMVALRHE